MNTSGNFVLPTVPQYHNYEELSFMKDQAPSHIASPIVCGFPVILLFGGLGVEDQGLRQTPIVLQAISYRGFNKQRTLDEMNNKFEMFLLLFLFTFTEKFLSLSSRMQRCVQNDGV